MIMERADNMTVMDRKSRGLLSEERIKRCVIRNTVFYKKIIYRYIN